MGIFRRTAAVLGVLLMVFTGCTRENLSGNLPGKTDRTEKAQLLVELDTSRRYTCRFLEPPEGGAFRQTLQASGGLLIDIEGFSYLLGDAVYLQCFKGKTESVEIYDKSGSHLRSVSVPSFDGLTWAPEYVLTAEDYFLVAANDSSYSCYGYTVKITYQNGDYDILSPTGQLYEMGEDFNENNWNCDEDKWNRFIKDYFTVDQPEESTAAPVP